MNARELLRAHRYEEAIAIARQRLSEDADDWVAMNALALALRATGQYRLALPLFERMDTHERNDSRAMGLPGYWKDVSCLYWLLGDKLTAIAKMRSLVGGVLDRSVQFGDLAGGVEQGLLLYYMGIFAPDNDARRYALSYMRNRAARRAIRNWPGPAALYYLDRIEFSDVVLAATNGKASDASEAVELARDDLLKRREVCVMLFHDGVKARALGDEATFHRRMKQCCSLKNPLLEVEWYLARHELSRSN